MKKRYYRVNPGGVGSLCTEPKLILLKHWCIGSKIFLFRDDRGNLNIKVYKNIKKLALRDMNSKSLKMHLVAVGVGMGNITVGEKGHAVVGVC